MRTLARRRFNTEQRQENAGPPGNSDVELHWPPPHPDIPLPPPPRPLPSRRKASRRSIGSAAPDLVQLSGAHSLDELDKTAGVSW